MEGFNYSNAMKAKDGPWTYTDLNQWSAKPSAYAPGTRMIFPGIPDPQLRADVIAWLRTLAATPKPLPAVTSDQLSSRSQGRVRRHACPRP